VVFHAAAYKHVSMMELNPVEAVRNNALATRLVARIAGECAVSRFVLVSTDKAVNPATVMGASKALAEWAVEAEAALHPPPTNATGPVRQRARLVGSCPDLPPSDASGGPVTVTDERMTRYFMRSRGRSADHPLGIAQGRAQREVFVLEMASRCRSAIWPSTMIRLSGLEPERDIAIEVIGPPPARSSRGMFDTFEHPTRPPCSASSRAEATRWTRNGCGRTFDEINLLVWKVTPPRWRTPSPSCPEPASPALRGRPAGLAP